MTTLLLDMDGVLVDVSGSYRRAVAETFAHFAGRELAAGAIQEKKDAGGFNNDWVLTHTLLAEAGADVPYADVVADFRRRYRGDAYDGLIRTERPAIQTATLERLAERYALALVTGRPEADAQWTLDHFGWAELIPVVIGMDQQAGREKPDPYPVRLALERLGADAAGAAFAGDTVDDIAAARGAGVLPIGVVPPGHPPSHGDTLRAAGAALVLASPDGLPAALQSAAEGRGAERGG